MKQGKQNKPKICQSRTSLHTLTFFHISYVPILCFLIPFLYYVILSAGFYITGEGYFLPYDSINQYVPFFSEYRYKLINHESLFYTFHAGGGWDFYTLWSYYLASPINLLIVFFKNILQGVMFIQAVKIGLCGLSFCWVINKKFQVKDISQLAFSLCYAMSGYVTAYYFNVMWLDTLILFPLLIYFLDEYIEKKSFLYPLMLGATVFVNFYMAVQVCFFIILYFITREFSGLKDFLKKAARVFAGSLLGVLMGAVIILPYAVNALGGNKMSIMEPYVMEDFMKIFASHFALAKNDVDLSFSSGANIYCGILSIVLLIMYFLGKKDRGEKIRNAVLLMFLFVSMNISTMTFIFHGFDKPTGYMARYSYMYIYVILMIAYEQWINLDLKDKKQSNRFFVATTVCILFIGVFCLYMHHFYSMEKYMQSVLFTLSLLFMYLLLANKKSIMLFLMAEIIISSICNIKASNVTGVEEKMAEIKQMQMGDGFTREIIDEKKTSNECMLYNMKGLSLFSSTLTKPYSSFVFKNGFNGGTNYVMSIGHTPVTELLFGIEYVYGLKESSYYSFEKVKESETYATFKNKYPVSIGYVVPESLLNWNWDISNPYQVINNFVCSYYDDFSYSNEVYQRVNADNIVVDAELEYEIVSSANYGVKILENEGTSKINFSHMVDSDNLSINLKGEVNSCKIYVNEEEVLSKGKSNGGIIPLLNLTKGDMVRIEIKTKAESGSIYANMAYFNEDVFERLASDLTEKTVEITEMQDNKISGIIPDIKEDEILLLSVPYLEGWNYSDSSGSRKIISDICLSAVFAKEGEFSMEYKTKGFQSGLMITGASLFAFLVIICIRKKKNDNQEY